MTRRPVVAVVLVLLAVSIGLAVTLSRPAADRAAEGPDVPSSAGPGSAAAGTPSPIPVPGHEVYGFVPYWEMDATIADHLAATDLTTIGLFSVTHRKNGSLSTGENGYKRITGPIGRADPRRRPRPRRADRARLHVVRVREERRVLHELRRPRRGRSASSSRWPATSASTGSTSTSSSSGSSTSRRTASSSGGSGRRSARRTRRPRSPSPRPPTSAARRWPWRPAWPARTGSS